MKHESRILWFDFIRGTSALAVCAGHLRAAILVDYRYLHNPNLVLRLFYFATSLGHEAVIVFFVLSGFFVGGSVLHLGARFTWLEYSVARISRLWTVLIPALVFTAVVDRIIERLDPAALMGTYYNRWNSGPSIGNFSESIATFMGNLAFLQTIIVPVFGANGPLWSLANEFWYYFLFPLLVCAFNVRGTNYRPLWRLAFAIAAIVILIWLPAGLRDGFGIWIIGVVVWLLSFRQSSNWHLVGNTLGVIAFCIALFYSKSPALRNYFNISPDLLIGLGFGVLAASLVQRSNSGKHNALFLRFSQGLSEFSYSLYLAHFPIVLLIAVGFYHSRKVQPDAMALLIYFIWLCVLIAIGLLFWRLFETKTRILRQVTTRIFKDMRETARR